MVMKFRTLLEDKYKLEDTIEGLERILRADTNRNISMTQTQAERVTNLLHSYKKLLDNILDNAEIDI